MHFVPCSKRPRTLLVPLATVIMAIGGGQVPAHAGQTYSVVGVGEELARSSALGLNDDRTVVGAEESGLGSDAFLWVDGSFVPLDLGASDSDAEAVNASGSIVGYRVQVAEFQNAYLREATGFVVDVHAQIKEVRPAVDESVLSDLNDAGQAAGIAFENIGEAVGIVWSPEQIRFLRGLDDGFTMTQAIAINEHGDAGGWDFLFGNFHGVIWRAADGYSPTEVTGLAGSSDNVFVYDLNEVTQVVGQSPREAGPPTAFRWEAGAASPLGDVGLDTSAAFAVNAAGIAAGQACTLAGECEAVVWPAPGEGYALNDRLVNDADWSFFTLSDIALDGTVVGTAFRFGGPDPIAAMAVPDLGTVAPTDLQAGEPAAFTVRDGVPGTTVRLLGAPTGGITPLPGCPGAELDLANPKSLGTATVAADGTAEIVIQVPEGAAGRTIRFQAASTQACMVGNPVVRTVQ